LVAADEPFAKSFHGLFKRLVFLTHFPENLNEEIHRLRLRIEKELGRETDRRWHYKKGRGGLVDIEFLVQYLQLKLGRVYDQLLTPNTLEALERLGSTQVLVAADRNALCEAYEFYRVLEIYLEARFKLKEGYLDPHHECVPALAELLGFPGPKDFLDYFKKTREEVRRIYLKVFQIK
jgi:glutamate-ammonia-ligase adenylyltransferase